MHRAEYNGAEIVQKLETVTELRQLKVPRKKSIFRRQYRTTPKFSYRKYRKPPVKPKRCVLAAEMYGGAIRKPPMKNRLAWKIFGWGQYLVYLGPEKFFAPVLWPTRSELWSTFFPYSNSQHVVSYRSPMPTMGLSLTPGPPPSVAGCTGPC